MLLAAPIAVAAVPALQTSYQPLDPTGLRRLILALAEPLRHAPPITPSLNVWSVAGLKRDELRNAAVLAWFLNPQESHGLGPAFLTAFLEDVARKMPDWPQPVADVSRTTVATEEWPLNSATDRVDIVLDGTDFVLFVEVKIDAPEGPDQISRYLAQVQRKAKATGRTYSGVVYLRPRRPQPIPPGVATITWKEVASTLSDLGKQTPGGALAAQFAQHIRNF